MVWSEKKQRWFYSSYEIKYRRIRLFFRLLRCDIRCAWTVSGTIWDGSDHKNAEKP